LSRFLLLPVISGGRLCAVQREEEDEEETPTVVKGKTQTNTTAAKVARENSYLKTAKLCFLVQNPDFLAARERERERYVFMFISCSEREKACAHAHNFVRSATKSGPDSRSFAPLRGRSASRLAAPLSFFLSNCPIQKLLQPTDPLRKKLLLAQKTDNAKNYNANSHAHNLKK
jgi:hypothetical protein